VPPCLAHRKKRKPRPKSGSKKVRIKKVENINGVEKTTDTMYYVNGPVTIADLSNNKEENPKKIVIITDEVHGDNISIATREEIDEQVKRAMKEVGSVDSLLNAKDLLVVNTDVNRDGVKGERKTKIVIIRSAKITNASSEDCKLLGKQTGIVDNKLAVENMNFYPNPNNGRFTLDFNLKDKGDTDIQVMNLEGRSVYSETLKDFNGNYKKEIDISSNPKGVYFVKVKQGEHSRLKKIVLE
jgi:hypothetical protein